MESNRSSPEQGCESLAPVPGYEFFARVPDDGESLKICLKRLEGHQRQSMRDAGKPIRSAFEEYRFLFQGRVAIQPTFVDVDGERDPSSLGVFYRQEPLRIEERDIPTAAQFQLVACLMGQRAARDCEVVAIPWTCFGSDEFNLLYKIYPLKALSAHSGDEVVRSARLYLWEGVGRIIRGETL